MRPQLFLDFETRSMADLRAVGTWAYSEHPTTEVICANWAVRYEFRGPLEWHLWTPLGCVVGIPGDDHHDGKELPTLLKLLGTSEAPELIAANVEFEASILTNVLNVHVDPDLCTCTHAMASYYRLPPKLEKYARMLGLGGKLEEGQHLIAKFSIPDKSTGLLNDCPEWMIDQFLTYCKHDVELSIGAHDLMRGTFPQSELDVFRWHLGVNMRGIPIDKDLLQKMQALQAQINTDVVIPDKFPKDKLTSVPFILSWLSERGIAAPDLRKDTIEKLLVRPIPADVRSVLKARLAISKASFDKLDAIEGALCRDQTIKGCHNYYGGHTGRFSSGGVQVQNFAKPPYGLDVSKCIEAVKACDLSALTEAAKGKPADGLVACMRPLICAPDGWTFIMADYGQIEARGAMWLAEDWPHVEMWRANADMYCVMATKLFGRKITKVDEKERDVGKRAVLSCCMQIGGNRFEEDAKEKYGLDLSTMNLTGDMVVDAFRAEFTTLSDRRTGLWSRLGKAILRAAQGHEQVINGMRITKTAQGHIMTRLKSGRCLFFRKAQIVDDPNFGPGVTYDSWSTKIRQYVREKLYGGSLTDIYTQATASDLLRNAVLLMKKDPTAPIICAHVHDSIMGLCRVERAEEAKATLKRCMLTVPEWADKFPLKVDIAVNQRFVKF